MNIKDINTDDLVAELLIRDDGLSFIDDSILADELVERNCDLNMFGNDTMIEALKARSKVNYVTSPYNYSDYCVSVEKGEMYHSTGRATILVVEG